MGSKKTTNYNQTTSNEPPKWTQPGLEYIGNRVMEILPTVPGDKYEGDFYAPVNQFEAGVPQGYADFANLTKQFGNQAINDYNRSLGSLSFGGPQLSTFGSYDASSVLPVIQAATNPIMRQLTEQVLPGIKSDSIASGAYSNSRAMSSLPAQAIDEFGRNASEIATQIAFQDFMQQEQNKLAAYGLETDRTLGFGATAPNALMSALQVSGMAPDIMAIAGAQQRANDQIGIDNALAQYEFDIMHPFKGLDYAANLLGAVGNPWGTQNTVGSSVTKTGGGLGGVLSGALGLAGTIAGIPGVSSLFKSVAPATAGPAGRGGF